MKNNTQPARKTEERKAVRVTIPTFDLSPFPDTQMLFYISRAHPEFWKLVTEEWVRGLSEQQIIQGMCDAGAPPIAMQNTAIVLRALRVVSEREWAAERAVAPTPPATAP